MGELFRSESMKYVQLILNEESAHAALRELGKFKLLHFEDHGAPDKSLYKQNKGRILECSVWKRRLGNIRIIMKQNGIKPPGPEVQRDDRFQVEGDFLDAIARFLEPLEEELVTQLNFKEEETRQLNKKREHKYIFGFARNHIPTFDERKGYDSMGTTERINEMENQTPERYHDDYSSTIYGTIPIIHQNQFQRILFRVTKGNSLCKFQPIHRDILIIDPKTGERVAKSAFSIQTVGQELPRRIRRICSLFPIELYDVSSVTLNSLEKQLYDIETVLKNANVSINKLLNTLIRDENGICPLVCWEKCVREEEAICETLQKFYSIDRDTSSKDIGSRIAAEAWVPTDEFTELKEVLKRVPGPPCTLNSSVKTPGMPPTFFRTNKFTGTFQAIVDTYGVADYQEANPGLFTIVTFPFLFGIMYGDIFHGSMIFTFGLFMLINEKKFLRQREKGEMDEIFAMAFGGRYLVVMMGFFAIFCGSIYNDCASIPFDLYGSHYKKIDGQRALVKRVNTPYPWGIDPEWYGKDNSLAFMNSFKMKMAVTLGVIQMTFGIILGLTNDLHFHDKLSILFEFLPRICFMLSTFGYMIFMILYKMCVNWDTNGMEPPNLIQTMIKMFLSPGFAPDPPLYHQATQHGIQVFLIVVAVLSIPLMLFPKSFIKYKQWKEKYGQQSPDNINADKPAYSRIQIDADTVEQGHDHDHDDDDDAGGHGHRHVGKNFSVTDDLITTGIHTIEFVLGCVSNTASYLRLWALSLAHAELSDVFWKKMIMQYGLEMYPMGFVGYAIWAVATVGVLLCMDVLECFLHALRLHWVEFQNKFYSGEGKKFVPFELPPKKKD